MKEILALDFGGSALKYALINEKMEFADAGRIAAPRKDKEEFLGCIQKLYERFEDRVSGIAISLAGIIDDKSGDVYLSGAFPFLAGSNLSELVEGICHVPVSVANDANCASFAELKYGNLEGIDEAIVIILGTAIGGTVIHNGEIYYGKHFSAGEFSLIRTEEGLESSWFKKNGSRALMKLVKKYKKTDIEYSGEEIFEMANHGDPGAVEALDEFCHYLAIRVYNMQAIFDTDRIAIGGGISAQPLLFALLDKNLTDIFDREKDYRFPVVKPEVVPCKFRNRANLLGAYILFVSRL